MYEELKLPITPIFIFPPEQIDPKKNSGKTQRGK